MKKILLATTALLSVPAFGQVAGVKPTDLPPFVEQPHILPDNGQNEIIGDGLGLTPWGGTPPFAATQLADIPTPNRESYLFNGPSLCGGDPSNPLHCTGPGGVYRAPQPKFRTTILACNYYAYDDPVLYYGQAGKSHLHEFYGNCGTNASSTFASLRNEKLAKSVAGGSNLNRTAYWVAAVCQLPGLNKFGDNRDYCMRVNYVTVYYECEDVATCQKAIKIPLGLRYVFGMRMTDPDDNYVKSLIAAGNAKPGNAGRYAYRGNGVKGWICVNNGVNILTAAGQSYSESLALADGSDPWAGACKGRDAPGISSMEMIAELNGPECSDGINLWGGPSGQNHAFQKVTDTRIGKGICYNNSYHLPGLNLKVSYTFNTTGEWVNYFCAGDAMAQASLVAQGSSRIIKRCESLHGDWFGAWDGQTLNTWQESLGIQGGRSDGQVYELNDNTISPTQNMGSQPLTIYGTSSPSVMWRKPLVESGPEKHMGHTM